MIQGLDVVDMVCCIAMAGTGGWLMTDPSLSRAARVGCALIACAACVNFIGLATMTLQGDFKLRRGIWPSDVLLDMGVTWLIVRWAAVQHRRQRSRRCL
jgi:hypothetical protein